ncbi:MAG TPA: GNAT family N-acetyltransferase [Acetobacteraceae bacterium]|jgi:predicted GNAT superfamily acetyltransferase|nr:GNAT family N-acetyltransferase [Acetobacteraceae bacterium]
MQIDRATRDDIDGILALQEGNQPEIGGMLSARLPAAWFEAALDDMPIIVARRDGRVVGYLVSASRAAVAEVPVIAAMLRAYPGAGDAYVYGPVCVAAEERGRGVAAAMFAALRVELPRREGILFIRTDNVASLRAHGRMGVRRVATFEHDGAELAVFAYLG